MTINNRDEACEKLAEIIARLDKELNPYQTDVYAYIDNGNVVFHEFTNVGGNSWLDDDHYTIYTDEAHNDKPIDYFTTVNDIAEALGTDVATLTEQTRQYCGLQDGDSVDYSDVYYYADQKHPDEIRKAFQEFDFDVNYYNIAEEIISELETR